MGTSDGIAGNGGERGLALFYLFTFLPFKSPSYHEPGMNCKGGKKAVMGAHHLETLLQGGLMILRGHAAIQKMGEDGMDVAQRELAAR